MQSAGIRWRWRATQFYFPLSGNNQNKTKGKSIAGISRITGAKLRSLYFLSTSVYWESMIRQSMHNKYYFMGVFNVLMCSTNKCGCGVSLHFITCCYTYFLWGSHLQRQTGRSSLGREKLSQPSLCRCCWNVYFMRQHSVRTNFNGCCNTSYITSV